MPSYQKHIVKDVSTASYIIFIDPKSGIIKARNGLTGRIDYEDYDASTVIQYGIDHEGKIFLMPGKYYIYNTINLKPGITIEGVFSRYGMDKGVVLIQKFNGDIFSYIGTDRDSIGIIIKNIAIYGDKSVYSGSGIYIENGKHFHISTVFVRQMEYGLKLNRTGNAFIYGNKFVECGKDCIYLNDVHDTMIYHNDIGNSDSGDGIHDAGSSSLQILGNKIYMARYGIYNASGNLIANNFIDSIRYHGIYLTVPSKRTIVEGNRLTKMNTDANPDGAGIYLDDSYIIVNGNMIHDPLNNTEYGIYSAVGYCIVISNFIQGVTTGLSLQTTDISDNNKTI